MSSDPPVFAANLEEVFLVLFFLSVVLPLVLGHSL
jgi:hypothetical protein